MSTSAKGNGSLTIGLRLFRVREELGLSQRGLGAPGVTFAHISRIEAGQRLPSWQALAALADKLNALRENRRHPFEHDITGLYLLTGEPDAPCPFCHREVSR